MSSHIPVLLNEVMDALQVKPDGRYIDCTVGAGGHSAAILERGGRVLGIDIDPQAIDTAQKSLSSYGDRINLINNSFDNLGKVCSETNFSPVDGILFDLGLSSLQIADAERGFSFRNEGPLRMSFDPSAELTAETIVNDYPETELAKIIRDYGEESRSKAIARAIVANRPISTTIQLSAIVSKVVGFHGRIHPATKTFQAIRIAVNRELERVKSALKQAVNILIVGGRLVVISFHSLEDRLVKEFMRIEAADCVCPPRTPACVCNHHARFKLITKKVVTPSSAEVEANPLSRSAKMRVAERI
ncbi:MAG: 16S rRNA (cytosine(1402)-N(4))-methyltransferase RsmH [Dehalococcoidia bacterium]|jgi:16S rRNA (cytosine1402-N4)-methyltransferase